MKKGRISMKKMISVLTAMTMLLCACGGTATADADTDEDVAGTYTAGTYTGSAEGFGGTVTVDVTIDTNGNITEVTVDAPDETPNVGGEAVQPMIDAIKEANSIEVDSVTSATFTSTAIIDAARAALTEAGVLGGGDSAEAGPASYTPGTYTGTADGRGGDIVATVTVSEDTIESIDIVGEDETVGISRMPMEKIPQDILDNQSLGVDTIAGATVTSRGVIAAVTAALEEAGANIDALRAVPVEKEIPPAEDMDTQVVIAGAGMAGLLAAITAANNGAEVVLVEKMPFVGGNLELAGGGLGTVDAETVDEDDSLERVMDYFKMVNETSERQPDYDFIEKLLPEIGATIDWLDETFHIPHSSTDRGDYVRTNFGADSQQGANFVDALAELVESQGVTLLLNTKAEHILMEDGKAVGLEVSNDGGTFNITADKTIIATGGASHDWDRLVAANPELNTIDFSEDAAVSSTGDGFAMLEEIGAKMDDGPFIKSAYPDVSPTFRYTFRNSPTMDDHLVVNAEGERVSNESPYNQMFLNKQLLRQASPAYYVLFDTVNIPEHVLADCEEFAANENNSVVVYAETIEDLAGKMEVDPDTLRATYDRYQELCANGEDPDQGKDPAHLIPYEEDGGFYAVRVYPASWGTIGGTLTDDTFHVLAEDDSVIENLFAVGEVATSRLFGDYYFGGFSLGFYTAAGHLAADTAVAEINAE